MNRLKKIFTEIKNNRLLLAALLAAAAVTALALSTEVRAQTTYLITDGSQVITHISHSEDPDQVLSEAGLVLGSEDTYTTQATEEGAQIVVRRARHVTVYDRGRELNLTCGDGTVAQVLAENGIELGKNSVVSVDEQTPIYENMKIMVDEVVRNVETYTVEIPFKTTYAYDDSLPGGETRVVNPGNAGQMQRKASVVYVNAEEKNRTVMEETVLLPPTNRVVNVGTGEFADPANQKPQIGDGKITLPSGDVLTYTHTGQFVATAYTQNGLDVNDITATGSKVHVGVVAVDPKVIPYGTRMFIVTNDGTYIYGLSTAEDCGGAIQGNRLDLYFDTAHECFQFGIKNCTVYFLGDANWR